MTDAKQMYRTLASYQRNVSWHGPLGVQLDVH